MRIERQAQHGAGVGRGGGFLLPALLVAGWLWGPLSASAQREPGIGYVVPAGGQRGTTFEVTVGGQNLDGAHGVFWSGGGVQAGVLAHDKPMVQRRMTEVREKLETVRGEMQTARREGRVTSPAGALELFLRLTEAQGVTRDDLIKMVEFRQQRNDPKRQINPQIAEKVRLSITIAPDAQPGTRELRLLTRQGVSNPLVFRVGEWSEFREPQPVVDLALEFARELRANPPGASANTGAVHRVRLPVVLNGQVLPGETDSYRFSARRGQQVVVAVEARALIPYLADAVPGWFQAVVGLYDSSGRELAFADDFHFSPDPMLCFTIPRDGDYRVDIRDAIYRGREDFVYRVTVGEVPFVARVFPPGCRAGTVASVAVEGCNLPSTNMVFDATERRPGRHEWTPGAGMLVPHAMAFAVNDLPEVMERSSGGEAVAQVLTLPVIVNGRIAAPGEVDVFRFAGGAGETVVVEVNARRLGSPLDSVVWITNARGERIAFNDDHDDPAAGLITHQADSQVRCVLPAQGDYVVHVQDAQRRGGVDFAYRLRVSEPRPDFELRVSPATINARAGTTAPLTVRAVRRDGFDGDIHLALVEAPAGFGLDGGWIPGGQDEVRATLTVPGGAASREPHAVVMQGHAVVGGRDMVRPAVPADDSMQAFFYRHLVPVRQLVVGVSGSGRGGSPVHISSAVPVRIPAGGASPVRLVAPKMFAAALLELDNAPAGVTLTGVRPVQGGVELTLASDALKVSPGLKGNLLVRASTESPAGAGKEARRTALGFLPAIPFEVVAATGDMKPAQEALRTGRLNSGGSTP